MLVDFDKTGVPETGPLQSDGLPAGSSAQF
jgi:hypothetical protein